MKYNIKFDILAAAVAMGVVPSVAYGQAEELSNTITIDRIIVPEERAVTRIGAVPELLPPRVKVKRLLFAEYGESSEITRSLMSTKPVQWGDTVVLPYRGYVSAAYLPLFNASVSAGYRVADTRNTKADVWMQYDGFSYKGKWADDAVAGHNDGSYRENSVSLGGSLRQYIGVGSVLSADAGYTYYDVSQPFVGNGFATGANRFDIGLCWTSDHRGWDYHAAAGFSMFGFTKGAVYDAPEGVTEELHWRPVNEYSFNVKGGVEAKFREMSRLGLDADVTFVHFGHTGVLGAAYVGGMPSMEEGSPLTRGLIRLTPYYVFKSGAVDLRLGARVDVTSHGGKAIHVAPDVLFGWSPEAAFAFYAKAGGGEHLNTLASLWDYTHMMSPSLTYGFSHIPLSVETGITIGEIKGFSAVLSAGYTRANDWLMPVVVGGRCLAFERVDMRGWHIAGHISYRYRNLVGIHAGYEAAPQSSNNGYYLWRDRAKWIACAGLEFRPVDALEVTFDYNYRSGRRGRSVAGDMSGEVSMVGLRPVGSLDIGASYRITEALTATLGLNNVFNRHYYGFAGIPGRGFNGLAGVSYRF